MQIKDIIAAIDAAQTIKIGWIPERENRMTRLTRTVLEQQVIVACSSAVNRWLYSR
jgi:hypothetical protein